MITLFVTVNFEVTLMSSGPLSDGRLLSCKAMRQSTNRPGIPGLFASNQLLSGLSLSTIAITAKDLTPFAGLERYFSVLVALSANGWEHLPTATVETGAAVGAADTFGFPNLTARRATLRIVSVAALCEQFLLGAAEGERCPAVSAGDGFVCETHRMTYSIVLWLV